MRRPEEEEPESAPGLPPPSTAPEATPLDGFILLFAAAVLFVAGGWYIRVHNPTLTNLAFLELGALLAPTVVWALLRGFLVKIWPSAKVGKRGLAYAFLLMAGGSFAALGIATLISAIPGVQARETVLEAALLRYPAYLRILLFALLPALCEETLFRGALLHCFRRWGAVRACIASGLLFALFHLSAAQFLPVAILGTALAFVVWKTGNIWLSMLGHFAHNSFILLSIALPAGKDHPAVLPGAFSLLFVGVVLVSLAAATARRGFRRSG
ncbi:MAG: type II CAAX endopeptidase family protein [Acidobacteriota bacterium]